MSGARTLGGVRVKGYSLGWNTIVRCKQGHLFTTIWIPGASVKSLRLGSSRFQRCPVGKHWTRVRPVKDADLTDEIRGSRRRLATYASPELELTAVAGSPNIVLVMSDQHRADMMGCAGDAGVLTPNLDALAASGVRFERVTCQGPLCMPARASFMTERYVRDHGVYTNWAEIASDAPTYTWALRDAGYHTDARRQGASLPRRDPHRDAHRRPRAPTRIARVHRRARDR